MQRFSARGACGALFVAVFLGFTGSLWATEDGKPGEAGLFPVQPPLIQVDEISVTAARAERAVLDQPGNITVITREEILESGVNTVPELLRRQAGIYVTNSASPSPTDVNVEVRGFNNGGGNGSRTLVLIDGRRANLAQKGVADWALIKLDDVERVEIVRGPVSAVYGDGAVGGVIEIFTRRVENRVQYDLTIRGGNDDVLQGSLFAGGRVADLSGSFFLDGLTAAGYRDGDSFQTRSAKANLRSALGEGWIIDAEGGYSSDRRRVSGALTRSQIESLGRRAADPQYTKNANEVENRYAQIVLEGRLLEDVILKLQPYWRQWTQEADIGYRGGGSYRRDAKTQAVSINGQLAVGRSLGSIPNQLVVGGDWLYEPDRRTEVYIDAANPAWSYAYDASNRRYIVSGYLQEEIEPIANVFLSGGVRLDYARYRIRGEDWSGSYDVTDDSTQWSPKGALTWRIFDPASVYFSYNQGLRFPNFDEIYFTKGRTKQLDPELSSSYEIGVKYRDGKIRAGLAFYHMDVDDEIVCYLEVGSLFCANQNIDRVRHRGIEVSVSYRPWSWFEVYGNYTHDNTEVREYGLVPAAVGKQLPVTPENRGTVGLNFFLPVPWLEFAEVGVNADIVGPRYVANDFANRYPMLGTDGVVDLHGRVVKKLAGMLELTIFFEVRNLANEKYSAMAGLNSSSEIGYYPSPGTNFDIGLSVSFEQ